MSSNSGRVEDIVQYRSLGPGVSEAGSGVRGYSQYDHPGLLGHGPWCGGGRPGVGGFISPAVSCSGAGLSLARSTSHTSHTSLSSNKFAAAEAESDAVTCSVIRDSLRVCTTGCLKKMVFSGKMAITSFKLIQNAKSGGVLENSGYLLRYGH